MKRGGATFGGVFVFLFFFGCVATKAPSGGAGGSGATDAGACVNDSECSVGSKCDLTASQCYPTCQTASPSADAGVDAGADPNAVKPATCGATQVCNPTTLKCVEKCNANSCAATPSTPECNTATGLCEACVDDAYAGNQALSLARVVAIGDYTNLRVCSGKNDWFALDLALRDRLRIDLIFLKANGNLDLELWDTTKTVVLAAGTTLGDNEFVAATVPIAGRYYLHVKGTESKNVPYEMIVAVTPESQAIGTCTADVFEANDTRSQSKSIERISYTGLTLCGSSDEDWYSLALTAGEKLRLDVLFPAIEGNLDAQIYQPDGVTLLGSGAATADNETVTVTAPSTGTYFVRVYRTGTEVSNGYAMVVTVTPPCSDDASEPNGVSLQATTVSAGNYPSLKICPLNEDWFKISLNANDMLVAEALFSVVAGNLNMQVIDRDGTTVLATGASASDNERVSYRVGYPGTYYVRVYGNPNSVTNSYELRLAVYAGCAADAKEPNGTPSTASNIATLPSTTTGLTVCPGDEDWFKVTLNSGDRLVATSIFSSNLGDIQMQMYSTDGITLLASSLGTNDDELIAYTVQQTGVYYLRVYGATTQVWNNYTLTIDKTAACTNDVIDNAAPNNDYFVATATGPATFTGLVICPGDEDWFAIALNAGEQLVASAAFTYTLGNLDLQIYRTDGATLAATATAQNDNEYISYVAPSSGTYYLRVYGAGLLVTNTYTLNINKTGTCTNDAYDTVDGGTTNQAYFQATPLTSGTYNSLTICPADIDFYKVTLSAGERITAALTFTNGSGNIDLQLYGTDGVSLLGTSNSTTADSEQIAYTATVDGTYYVRVYGANASVNNGYTLSIAVQAACTNDGYESNNSWVFASTIDAGTTSGLKICPTDVDFFRVALTQGARLTATSSFTNLTGNLDMQIYGTDGVAIAGTSATTNDYETIVYTAPVAGDYFLRIYGQNAAVTNSYALTTTIKSCVNDAVEPNNNYTQAANVSVAQDGVSYDAGSYVLCAEEDWFKVYVDAGATARIVASINFNNPTGNLSFQLYRPDGTTVWQTSATTANTETVSQFVTNATYGNGFYYLRVYGAATTESNPYDLFVRVDP